MRSQDIFNHSTLLMGIILIVLLAASDYIWPGAAWWSEHPMTATAISTILFFVAVTMLFERWLRGRQARQLEMISTVAYRSLAQQVNDVGRCLLVPFTGIDIDKLGIPQIWPETNIEVSKRLDKFGKRLPITPKTGSWNSAERQDFIRLANLFLTDPDFLQSLFLCVSRSRRLLHETTSNWAATMLVSTSTSGDLGKLRLLTDSLELLQERARAMIADPQDAPSEDLAGSVTEQYWQVICDYQELRNFYGDQAALPSDQIVDRKENSQR